MIIIDILPVAAGIVLLYIGGECLVRSAMAISNRFGISRLVIGLTVVALGTSLPELFVSFAAVLNATAEIAVANLIGSNIINIALILPLIPLVAPLIVPRQLRVIDYPIMLLSFIVVAVLAINWHPATGDIQLRISRFDGALLLALLIGYLCYLAQSIARRTAAASAHPGATADTTASTHPRTAAGTTAERTLPMRTAIVLLVVGAVALRYGSTLLVDGAVIVATALRISTRVIALTVVAHGTNLPELFATIAALRKKEQTIALGNMIGSNIINTLFIFGMIGLGTPFTIDGASDLLHDLGALIAISGYVFLILLSTKNTSMLGRGHGIWILLPYVGYFVWVVIAR